MPNGILVFIEQREGAIKIQGLQALSVGRSLAASLGGKLSAVLIGNALAGISGQLATYGPATVLTADAAHLADYRNASYADAVVAAVAAVDPAVVLFSATAMGKDLAPAVAAKLGCGVVTDVTGVAVEGGALTIRKPIYAGKCIATYRSRNLPLVLSLRPNVFPAQPAEAPSNPVEQALTVAPAATDPKSVSYIEPEVKELDVAEASIIVSGGRGLKEPDNFKHVRALADSLGAAVGASRAVVDAGWIGHKHQVGQTGKTVSPSLYVALGISGAIQHLAGMSSSKLIAAINKDADAPIFKIADFGMVGDLFSVIEKITEKVKQAKHSS